MIVFTALFGQYDMLRPPQVVDSEFRYVCFSDEQQNVEPWETVVLPRTHISPRRDSRMVKYLAHLYLHVEYSVYHDAAYYPKIMPSEMVEWLTAHDIALYANPYRDCIYDEAAICMQYKADDPEVILQQMGQYQDEGYPEHFGLARGPVLVRRHTPNVQRFNELMWVTMSRYSYRDQLSIDYVLWKLGMSYNRLSADSYWDAVQEYPHNEGAKWSQYGPPEEWF